MHLLGPQGAPRRWSQSARLLPAKPPAATHTQFTRLTPLLRTLPVPLPCLTSCENSPTCGKCCCCSTQVKDALKTMVKRKCPSVKR